MCLIDAEHFILILRITNAERRGESIALHYGRASDDFTRLICEIYNALHEFMLINSLVVLCQNTA